MRQKLKAFFLGHKADCFVALAIFVTLGAIAIGSHYSENKFSEQDNEIASDLLRDLRSAMPSDLVSMDNRWYMVFEATQQPPFTTLVLRDQNGKLVEKLAVYQSSTNDLLPRINEVIHRSNPDWEEANASFWNQK